MDQSVVVLETKRLLLRELTLEDLDALDAMYQDPEVMRYLFGIQPRVQTEQDIIWNRERYKKYGFGFWATLLKPDLRFIGRCGLILSEVDGITEREVAYGLVRAYWGAGLATEAARAIRDYSFYRLGFYRLVSIVDHDNIASRRVAEKNGMRIEKDILYKGDPCYLYAIARPVLDISSWGFPSRAEDHTEKKGSSDKTAT